jgi:hypothetical protein
VVFDRNLVLQLLEDHQLPSRFAKLLPEDRTSGIGEIFDELLGYHTRRSPNW